MKSRHPQFDTLDVGGSRLKQFLILVSIFVLLTQTSSAIELKAETVADFDKYIAVVEARMEPRFSGRSFLWSDEYPTAREQLHKGLTVAQPVRGNGVVPLKGGLAQDWLGGLAPAK